MPTPWYLSFGPKICSYMGQNWPNLALKSKILKYTCVICHFKGNFKQNTNSLLKIEKNVSKSSGGGFRGLLITKFEKFGPELIQYQHLICYSLLSRELNFECSKCFFGVRYCPPSLQEKFGPNLKKFLGGLVQIPWKASKCLFVFWSYFVRVKFVETIFLQEHDTKCYTKLE